MVSAADLQDITDLKDSLAYFGKFLELVMKDENAMLFLVLLIVALMLATLLRKLLGKIPIFQGEGDAPCNGQGTIIAWCMTLLTVLSIGWNAYQKKIGTTALVSAMVGPYSLYFILLLSAFGTYWVYKACENMADKWRRFWTVAMFCFCIGWLLSVRTGIAAESPIFAITLAASLGFAWGFFISRRGRP
jgi:hypothetical protein